MSRLERRRHEPHTDGTQRTDGVNYGFEYGYHKGWSLKRMRYPSGSWVRYTPDAAERVAVVDGLRSDETLEKTYWQGVQYAPQGAPKRITLGSSPVIYQHAQFNARQQVTNIKVGTGGTYGDAAAADRLALTFTYGSANNNGNILTQLIQVPGGSFAQTYQYDQLNRLCTVREVQSASPWGPHTCGDMQGLFGSESWRQTFGYDRFGNQWVAQHLGANMPYSGLRPTQQSNINAANNRLAEVANQIAFDAAGQQVRHGGWTLAYDAEGRVKTATPSSGAAAAYEYDGDGRRVKKTVGGVSTWYVYDASGQLAAEYTTAGPSGSAETHYITTDHLGSTRLVTRQDGTVVSRHDYLPFGEEVPNNLGGRTAAMGYVANPAVAQKFTGKERDTETGLDYFGARYLSGAMGRFGSADRHNPIMIAQMATAGGLPAEAARSQMSEFLENPQNWNKYTYVLNNPLRFVDPFGESPIPAGHHLIPNRVNLGPVGTEFANAIRTGPLANNYPNQPGFNNLHRAYNAAAEGILQQFEHQFGASRSAWTVSQWRQAANGILNSRLPAIRNFLDLLNKNNSGKALPALAAAINSYAPSAGLLTRVAASSLLRLLRLPLILFFDPRVVTEHEHRDPESDRLPPHQRCLKSRDGTCVI